MKRYIKAKVEINPTELDLEDLWELVRDPNAAPEMLEQILKTTDSHHAFTSVLKHPNLPLKTLLDYIYNPTNYAMPGERFYAFQNPNLPEEFLSDLDSSWWKDLVYNDRVTPNVLEQLAEKYADDAAIMKGVAINPNTPRYILDQLVYNESLSVRGYLARNLNIPYELQQILADDSEPFVKLGLIENPNVAIDIIEYLTKDDYDNVRRDAERCLARRGNK